MKQLKLLDHVPDNDVKPFRRQLLKWSGNKQRIAHEIVSHFPEKGGKYFEPFLGSGAVLATYAPEKGVGSDNFRPLMEIWQTLKKSPRTLMKWYTERWEKMKSGEKAEVYEEIKAHYNRSPNGGDLLFLSHSCSEGALRFRADGSLSTLSSLHDPISPEAFAKRVVLWSERVKGCDFLLLDFEDAMSLAKAGDVIYCDPPGTGGLGLLPGAGDFRLQDLFRVIEKCKAKGTHVLLSFDGTKKSGNFIGDTEIPPGLFKREVSVNSDSSRSGIPRTKGKTSEAGMGKNRLLLTY
ncbi:MAG TPA: DNA adenine methylase [Thermodesulfovibrionales bacterium]|jgi:DNA adenine methylase|nr:DNA adenine methylase [Thermodesulfovibrionales bacterium]